MTAPGAADAVLAELARLSTPTVSDALDRLAIAGQVLGVMPVAGAATLAGRAHSALYQPVDAAGGTVGDYIDDVEPGSVVVLDNAGRTDCTVWGDILTTVASRRGIAGTVINGVCRDITRARAVGYPIFARGNWMRTGKDRVAMVGVQVPVTLGGVLVRPGDIVLGDADGVVIVPRSREGEVLEAALAIEAAEEAIRARCAEGARLDEARRLFGYHVLQTHRET
jgi:4-hydroxy-4-methyl-2-oxoglutarate aldolase